MTATEMEDLLKNLDLRLSNVEQILPTLATKEDLKTGLEDAKRHADIRFERLEEKIDTLAEHLADVSPRLLPRT